MLDADKLSLLAGIPVCEILGILHSTVYQEINAGALETIKIKSRRIVTQDQLNQYLKTKESQASTLAQ